MQLIELSNGRVSAEFDDESEHEIADVLAGLNAQVVSSGIDYQIVEAHGCKFILVGEWEGRALLSMSPAGDVLLRRWAAPSFSAVQQTA